MDLETVMSFNWRAMTPEFIILITTIVLSVVDLFWENEKKKPWIGAMAIGGVLLATISLVTLFSSETVEILFGTFRLDGFAKAFKLIFLIGTLLVLLQATGDKTTAALKFRGEYYYLLLCALLGAMFMVSSADLITMVIGLELLSITSYVLVGLRKDHKRSNEAAMKYVVNGGIASAFTLFGMSYLYGITGTSNIYEMRIVLAENLQLDHLWMLAIAFFFIFVGLSFKIAVVPFHMWAPDVYEGATTPVTTFLSVVSKAAGFGLVVRLFLLIFASLPSNDAAEPFIISIQTILAVVAVITMVVANIIALKQTNIKRLLAYSSIAHAGYILVPLITMSAFLFSATWFYLLVYVFMNVGALTVLQIVANTKDEEDMNAFAGLYKRNPILAIFMSIFLLSLAGIPGTAGFIAKVNILLAAFSVDSINIILAAGIIIATGISYVYYFGIMVQMFAREPKSDSIVTISKMNWVILLLSAVATVVLGIFPNIGIDLFFEQLNIIADFIGE